MSAVRTMLRLLLLLLSGAGVGAANLTQFFVVGDTIKLSLVQPSPEPITTIVWKREPNIVAEWSDGVYGSYKPFQDRTTVDNTTGLLEIRTATAGDSGQYEVEVNGKLQDTVYLVDVIKGVQKPSVWIQPVGCGPSSPQCQLNCEGSTDGAGAVTYSWNWGEGWNQLEKVLVITNTWAKFAQFSCRVKNNINSEDSDPKHNPFFREETSSSVLLPAILVPLFLVFVILGVVIYFKRTEIRTYFSRNGHAPVNQTPPPENGVELGKIDPANESNHL